MFELSSLALIWFKCSDSRRFLGFCASSALWCEYPIRPSMASSRESRRSRSSHRGRSRSPPDLLTTWHRRHKRCGLCKHRVIGRGGNICVLDGYPTAAMAHRCAGNLPPADYDGPMGPQYYFCGHCLFFRYSQVERMAPDSVHSEQSPTQFGKLY